MYVIGYLITWNKNMVSRGKTHWKNSRYSIVIFIGNSYIWIIRLKVWQTLIGQPIPHSQLPLSGTFTTRSNSIKWDISRSLQSGTIMSWLKGADWSHGPLFVLSVPQWISWWIHDHIVISANHGSEGKKTKPWNQLLDTTRKN